MVSLRAGLMAGMFSLAMVCAVQEKYEEVRVWMAPMLEKQVNSSQHGSWSSYLRANCQQCAGVNESYISSWLGYFVWIRLSVLINYWTFRCISQWLRVFVFKSNTPYPCCLRRFSKKRSADMKAMWSKTVCQGGQKHEKYTASPAFFCETPNL